MLLYHQLLLLSSWLIRVYILLPVNEIHSIASNNIRINDARIRSTPFLKEQGSTRMWQQEEQNHGESEKNEIDICIIGGGISGLCCAIKSASQNPNLNICVLESNDKKAGGRVASHRTEDGYVLDEGFAVFIENYPQSQQMLDFDALKLKPFDPGAMIRVSSKQQSNQKNKFATVADPIRQPRKLITALTSPVGTWKDKIKLLPLFYRVKTKSIQELFQEEEIDTMSCLRDQYRFSEKMITEFFTPFLKGVYLCPLEKQSSRMFHFVFKMFADGSATLPTGGMQTVSDQLVEKAVQLGVDVRLNYKVVQLSQNDDNNGFRVYQKFQSTLENNNNIVCSKKLVCATDGRIAQQLLSTLNGFEPLSDLPENPQLSTGCMYYSLKGDTPVTDPILILNGSGGEGPINNVAFPSVVNESYSPKGYHLCCVTLTEEILKEYRGNEAKLDKDVRRQLAEWFDTHSDDILKKWERKGPLYEIKNAQPSQLGGPCPANVHGGRNCDEFRGVKLPNGVYVCGDHMVSLLLLCTKLLYFYNLY